MVESDAGTDEALELIRRDLSQTFESRDLRRLDLGYRFEPLLLGVAIDRLVFVLDAEERGLEDIDVSFFDQIGEELEEESEHQQSYVHSVHIGIGGDDHFVVPQLVESVLYVERRLEAVELLVLIHHLFGQSIAIKGFASERENGLCADVAALGDRAGGGETLGDEDTTLQPQIVVGVLAALDRFGVVEVDLAVAQLGVVDQVLLRPLPCRLGHTCDRLALFLAVLDLLQHDLHDLRVLMQEIIELLLDKVIDELIDGDAAGGAHVLGTEFDLGLALEDRLFHVDGDRAHHAVADVGELLVLVEKLLDRPSDRFAESRLVRTALDGMLTVDERVILVAVLVGVGEGNLDVFALDMNDRVERTDGHVLRQQVQQTVLGDKFLTVIDEREPGVEVSVVTQQLLDIIVAEMVVLEQSFAVVGYELDHRTAFLGTGIVHDVGVGDQFALFELGAAHLTLAVGLYGEERGERINGFGSHAVQTHGFLEGLAVVFAAGVEHGDHFHEFAQRNTAPVVPHAHTTLCDLHFDHFAFAHAVLVDGVIDRLFDKDVDTVVGVAAVAEFTDIHTRSAPDMFHVVEVNNVRFAVLHGSRFYFCFFCHNSLIYCIAASLSLGMTPSRIASLTAAFSSPTSEQGSRWNIAMISSPLTGGWKLRIRSRSSSSTIFCLTSW